MPKPKSTVELIPSARRLIRSLRDVGYGFVNAVADLIDNSIAADASAVDVEMYFDGPGSWVRISDNGRGMTGTEISEAMRFGTEREYDESDLGKFGLGLKTASLSQCLNFTVASRCDADTRRVEVRQWDIGHVEKTNRWEVINVPADERSDCLVDPLMDHTGTVVLWEQLDRVLGYKVPWGERARAGFLRTAESLDQHLGMVFHRFMTGEAKRRKKLIIRINGTQIDPWDPFARDERETVEYEDQQFEVQTDNGRGLVGYKAYILPRLDSFSSPKAFNRYSGPAKWNFQQGFYIYRANRMIQSGGWSYLRTADEHTKLARVALDFRTDLDEAFELNISKAKVNLPSDLRNKMEPHVEELAKEARKVYGGSDKKGGQGLDGRKRDGGVTPGDRPGLRPALVGGSTGGGVGVISSVDVKQIGGSIDRAAMKAGEKIALTRIKQALREADPLVASTIGW